jgi:mono/diheme cytochrome c family protein
VVYRVAFEGGGARGSAAAPARRAVAGDPLASLDAAERGERATRGESLYQAHACAACHGAEPPPGVVAKPLAGLAERHDLESLEALLATPTPPMPALPLSSGERRDLAVYLFERHP